MANAQVTCRIEGELKDLIQGQTIVVYPYNVSLQTSDNHIETRADSKGHFGLDVTEILRMFLVDRDGTILSRSTDAGELEKLIENALQ